MVTLINFYTFDVWVLVCPAIFMAAVVDSNHILMTDVVAIALCWQMLYLGFVLCCVADGKPLKQMLLSHVADGVATLEWILF